MTNVKTKIEARKGSTRLQMSDKIMTECVICGKPYAENQKPEEGEYWSDGCWPCYFKQYPDEA